MQRIAMLALATTFAGVAAAQSNTVAGLNGRLTNISNITILGNSGTFVGLAAQNDMCNPGTVVIPWHAAGSGGQMQEDHPKFGFMVCRESAGRFLQISNRSFCKHAFTSVNGSGGCGTCQNPGTGAVMGVNCTDAYGVGNNGDPFWLGPAGEIDPWLGTWNHVGSFFDQGFPNVGAPGNTDGVRSNINIADSYTNRVNILNTDLGVAGAAYWYQIHLLHQGEAVANRGDNLMSRGVSFSGSGSRWSSSDSGAATYGSILTRWTGATVNLGGNGNDDGRFAVAVKVTGPVAGVYRYEYAVHNIDNSRAGASFKVPVAVNSNIANPFFRDIDQNALNQWTFAVAGGYATWSAPAGNALEWNTVYNFGFDSTISPGNATAQIDEARVGPGGLTVFVSTTSPTGLPAATVTPVGQGCVTCQASGYEYFGSPAAFDLSNSRMTMALTGGHYAVSTGTATFVAPTGTSLNMTDDSEANVTLPFSLPYPGGTTTQLHVCSNGFISPAGSNGTSFTPDASAFLLGSPCWAAAWHDYLPAGSGTAGQVVLDSSPTVVRITWNGVSSYGAANTPATFQYQFFPNGTVNIVWQNMNVAGSAYLTGWTPGGGSTSPARDLSVSIAAGFQLCQPEVTGLSLAANTLPIIGTSCQLQTSNVPAGSPFGAVLVGLTAANPAIDLTSQGMAGCFGYISGPSTTYLFVAPGATHVTPLVIPNNNGLTGLPLMTQSFVFTNPPLTALGAISSNGVGLIVGF